jgi:hypothetical protein
MSPCLKERRFPNRRFSCRLSQLAKCRVERRDPGQRRRIGSNHFEVFKIESGADRASHQAVFTPRFRRLPAARRNHRKWTTMGKTAGEHLFVHAVAIINPMECERIALMEMPCLIRSDPVPPAVLALNEEKVDRRQRCPRRSPVQRLHLVRRPEDLPEISAFRMRLQTQLPNQFPGPVVHLAFHLPLFTDSDVGRLQTFRGHFTNVRPSR